MEIISIKSNNLNASEKLEQISNRLIKIKTFKKCFSMNY